MTVYEFIQLLCFADDQKICVWDCDTDKTLYQGTASDLDFETAIAYRDKIKQLENIYLKS